jgi:hypothetical protein
MLVVPVLVKHDLPVHKTFAVNMGPLADFSKSIYSAHLAGASQAIAAQTECVTDTTAVLVQCTEALEMPVHYLIKSIRTSLCSSKLKPRCHYDRTYQYKRRQKAVCCSLLSSTSSMDRSGELTDFKCGLVIDCHISKKSVRDTATLLKLPKSTAGDVIVKWKREGTTTTG